MLEGINDSKKHYFVWTIVTLLIFFVPIIVAYFLTKYLPSEIIDEFEQIAVGSPDSLLSKYEDLLGYLLLYAIATLPIGIAVKKLYFEGKYIHIPNPKVVSIFEQDFGKVLIAGFQVIWCEILAVIDFIILCFNALLCVLTGMVIFPYHLVSGIVLMCKKSI